MKNTLRNNKAMKFGLWTFIAALGAVALVACGSTVPEPGDESEEVEETSPEQDVEEATPEPETVPSESDIALAGTAWKLVTLNGEPALADAEVTLSFTEAEVSGNAGCNSYSGGYSLDGSTLAFTPLISTMMACEGPLMDQESAFFAALQASESVSVEDGQLTLSAADGQSLVFEAQ